MTDNLKKKGPQDASKINTKEEWELDYWSNHFGVSKQKIIDAVKAVGNSVEKVKKYLGK